MRPWLTKQGVARSSGREAARVVFACAVLLAASGQLAAQDPEDAGRTDVALTTAAREVEAREVAFARTMADRDFAAFLTFVAEEAIFFAGDQPLRGRDAVGEAWQRFFEGPAAPFSWAPDVVEVLDSGALALSSGPVRNPAGDIVGRFSSIWRKSADGQWYVVFDKGCP